MSPIQELRQCLQDAENNRQQEDPGQTDLKWDGFIEGIKHAIYRLQMTAPVTSPVLWGQMLRYHTDDHDISSAQLCIQQGGNGDWYVSIADSPDHHPISGVRICTSGGAAALCPGLGIAIARAYQAMFDTQNRPQPSSITQLAQKSFAQQAKEVRVQAERVILGEEQPLSEHARKAMQADTPEWITPPPP